ncbi:MAG: YfcE family phosphodiesterase [Candidatus Bathyarchaeota archaeon]|nr:YfcE family phosphodiesterase [Candidatus Bathyarchaeota archaeon]
MSSKPKLLGYTEDESYCAFGVDRLSKLLEALEDQIGGVMQSSDIEYVHKMRVASRRIRATMPLFQTCFPEKKFKKWLRQVKQVTGLLGEARDLDVQTEFVKQYKKTSQAAAEELSLELLLSGIRTQRERIQPDVVKGLQALQTSCGLEEMHRFYDAAKEYLGESQFEPQQVKEKAHWTITSRINDFVEMEEYVHQENQSRKQHEMRIQAKWLRYTMETFAPLYPNKLKDDIETIKDFQDALGEMHDCDVWTERIPKFLDDLTNKPEFRHDNKTPQLTAFLDYVKTQRKKYYTRFVELWETSKQNGFFEQLQKKTGEGFPSADDKIKELKQNPEAKVAVIADVHGNLHALQAVMEDAEKRGANIFLNAGDSVGYGAFPNEVAQLLCAKQVVSVVGNFDLEVLSRDKNTKKGIKGVAVDFAKEQVDGSCRAFLLSLPREVKFEAGEKRLLLTHGSPQSIEEHLRPDTPQTRIEEIAQKTAADLIITGHSHQQYLRKAEGKFFLNPGSVGRPDDANPQAAYAVVTFKPFSVELLRVSYDVVAAADALRRNALPESFSQMLLKGVSIDEIAKEDRLRSEALEKSCREVVANCEEVACGYWAEVEHPKQVRKLSLQIFDDLQSLHELGTTERCWLECAAILHDIGMAKSAKAHNKNSMQLILNDPRLLLLSTQRRIIASIARYHRKTLPKKTHYNLLTLNSKTISKIRVLSGILRIGDSLDYSHDSVVQNVRVRGEDRRVVVEVAALEEPVLEQQAFIRKKDLLERALKRKVVLVWKQP